MAPTVARLSERWRSNDSRIPRLVSQWLGSIDWRLDGPFPKQRRVAIVSSRLTKLMDPCGSWLMGARAVLERARFAEHTIVIAPGTAGSELILRGATRLGLPVFVIEDESTKSIASRSASALVTETESTERIVRATFSSTAAESYSTATSPHELAATPAIDRATIAWADEIFLLRLRSSGNLHRLLRLHLQADHEKPTTVWLVDLPNLHAPRARDELIQLGAKLWQMPDSIRVTTLADCPPSRAAIDIGRIKPQTDIRTDETTHRSSIAPLSSPTDWCCLTHTTRACPGPWPNQSRLNYVDSLLDARPDSYHTAFETLRRIVTTQRLIAAATTIRGRNRVVSFTAVPLTDLPRLHVFRSHRSRWDFEPYGICVRREWLIERGARPVLYGDDTMWKQLAATDRPFFQFLRAPDHHLALTPTSRPAPIDWSVEQEWRHSGDLELNDLSHTDGFVFVPTAVEAEVLSKFSLWPVTVLQWERRHR